MTASPTEAASAVRPHRTIADRAKAAVVSCAGLGYVPVASGTFGTLGGVAVVLLLRMQTWFHFGGALVALSVVGLLIGLQLGDWAERYFGRKDPSPFVLDELVGYWITLFRWKSGVPGMVEIIAAFVAFRLFDVVKPPPARRFEGLPTGLGIMLDDVVAGVYAAMLIGVLREHLAWA